jgi:hypothetical protein
MSTILVLVLAGLVFGTFAIPFAAGVGLPLWVVIVTIGGAQVARTLAMQVAGIAASDRLAARAARKGNPYPPVSVEKAMNMAESRGVPLAGFLAPFITGTMAGVVVALAPEDERRGWVPWVTLGVVVKIGLYTVFWVLAIALGAQFAEQYIRG